MGDSQRHSNVVCLGTLALGLQYRVHAKLLAFDLLSFHPEIKLIVLTDKPIFFSDCPNVMPIKHRSTGIRFCYHDKRFVFKAAFRRFDSCLFIDADSRLLDAINFEELLSPDAFIVAPVVESLASKLEVEIHNKRPSLSFNGPSRKRYIFNRISKTMGINLSEVSFIQESIFLINKNKCNYESFLLAWDYCAAFTTARLFEFSEGSSMGLSAAYVGANVASLKKCPPWYFKDIYTDYSWKSEEQAQRSRDLILLRQAISNDHWANNGIFIRAISFIFSAVIFYTRNAKHLFSTSLLS
jgi:hypothetical protein